MKNDINILGHDLVPKHIVLSEAEKNKVMKKFGIKRVSQFPKIFKNDPALRDLEVNAGTLIKIIRKKFRLMRTSQEIKFG